MIVKILSRHSASFKSLAEYIVRGAGKEGKPQIFTHNLRSENTDGRVREFLENEAHRTYTRRNQVFIYHEIVSLSNKEDGTKITKSVLDALARKYISLRGKQGMFLGAVHRDKEHVHIHFMTAGLEYRTGKSFRLKKYQLQELKIKFQEYHRKKHPELTQSTVNHGKGREYVTDKEWQARHRDERSLAKKEVQDMVKACYARTHTQKEFLELLRENNLHFYERNGEPTGIIYNNLKIRFTRMEITKKQIENLRTDRTEEEQALAEIRAIRQRNNGPELSQSNGRKPGEREKEPTGIRGFMDALERPVREVQMANREAKDGDELEMD